MEKEGQTPEQTQAPAKRCGKNKYILIAFIIVASTLVIAGVVAFIINLNSNKSTEDTNSTTVATEVEAATNQLESDSNIDEAIKYFKETVNLYKSGEGYQELTPEGLAKLYTENMFKLVRHVGQYPNQEKIYVPIIFEFAYAAEDLVHTAETANNIYFVEYNFGSKEKAEQYKQIATERGAKFNSNPEGEG